MSSTSSCEHHDHVDIRTLSSNVDEKVNCEWGSGGVEGLLAEQEKKSKPPVAVASQYSDNWYRSSDLKVMSLAR